MIAWPRTQPTILVPNPLYISEIPISAETPSPPKSLLPARMHDPATRTMMITCLEIYIYIRIIHIYKYNIYIHIYIYIYVYI
jgi:hypothetical protein